MRIPGPSDLLKLTGQGYEALERAISLVPRLVVIVSEVENIMKRVKVVVSEIESTQHRATVVVTRIEAVVDRSEATVGSTEVVVGRAADLTRRIEPLLDRFQPALDKLEPIVTRLAETTSPAEVDAMVELVNALPAIVDKLDTDILPVLDTLATVAPDLRDLLDVSKDLNELIGSVPGLGRVKKKMDEKQESQDDYRAQEEPAAAPERQ